MAYIYKITNQKNGKMYIGKTIGTIAARWQGHLSDSRNPDRNHRHLYRAMNYYGIDNFTIEPIEEIKDINQLEEREQYWINYYDTYHHGYNETHGGDGKHYLDYDLICQKYQELGTCSAVARELHIDAGYVGVILKSQGITVKRYGACSIEEQRRREQIKKEKELLKQQEKELKQQEKENKYQLKQQQQKENNHNLTAVDMYDLDDNYIMTFSSIKEASEWCINNNYIESKVPRNVRVGICKCLAGKYKSSAQHKWKYHNK